MKLSLHLQRCAALLVSWVASIAHCAQTKYVNDGFLSLSAFRKQHFSKATSSPESTAPFLQDAKNITSADVARVILTTLLQEDLYIWGAWGDDSEEKDDGDDVTEIAGESAAETESEGSDEELKSSEDEHAYEFEEDEEDDEDEEDEEETEAERNVEANLDKYSVRPSAAEKKVDVISFGMFAKDFSFANLRAQTFAIDIILTMSWHDPRVIAEIGEGQDIITLSYKQARRLVWTPGVKITNREINSVETISSSVILDRSGAVAQVTRLVAIVKNVFNLEDFPFAIENLEVIIASTRYMLDEVQLMPLTTEVSGVRDGIFNDKGYEFQEFNMYVYDSVDGPLQKSRGVLQMTVRSTPTGYVDNHVLPSLLCLMISWTVFWIPFGPPQFSTPRLALSMLSLVVFTKRCSETNKKIPTNGPKNWNDVFNSHVAALLGATIILNIYAEFAFCQLKREDIAMVINHEQKIHYPFIAAVVVSFILVNATYSGGFSSNVTSIIASVFLFILYGHLAFYWSKKLWFEEEQFVKKESRLVRRASMVLFSGRRPEPEDQSQPPQT